MTRILFCFVVFCTIGSIDCFSQKQDYNWILGYRAIGEPMDSLIGNFLFKFYDEKLGIERVSLNLGLYDANSVLSSKNGEMILAISNGCQVFNGKFGPNSGQIDINRNSYWWDKEGSKINQGVLILDEPGKINNILVLYFHEDKPSGNEFVQCNKLIVSKFEINDSNTLNLIYKDSVLYEAPFSYGFLTCTRHANGRDWWFLLNNRVTNDLMEFYLGPDGFQYIGKFSFSLPSDVGSGIGQSCFSPNGEKFAIGTINGYDYKKGGYVDLYDFDRCSGIVSNKRNTFISDNTGFGGLAFSNNSKYLYYATQFGIYRVLSNSKDLESNSVKIDTFLGDKNNPFRCSFANMQLAPDGKIYMSSAGSNRCLSLINNPDEENIDSIGWSQNGILLPKYNFRSIPNIPYFRLSSEDFSRCDSLRIDNFPVAKFRIEQDTLDSQQFKFVNLSYGNPIDYTWNFSTGHKINVLNTTYRFDSSGNYKVCLRVTNQFGSDSLCKWINLEATDNYNIANDNFIECYPTLFDGDLKVHVTKYSAQKLKLLIYNVMGYEILNKQLINGINFINLSEIPLGIYSLIILQNKVIVKRGKIIRG